MEGLIILSGEVLNQALTQLTWRNIGSINDNLGAGAQVHKQLTFLGNPF